MKPAAEDLERRRPVWSAMSEFFLDTQLDPTDHLRIAEVLRASGYTLAELEQILWGELCPVLFANYLTVAGEWAGFDMDFVEQRILRHPAGCFSRWFSFLYGGNLARHDWRKVRTMLESPSS